MTSPNKLILEPATPDDIPTMIDIWFAAFTDPTMQRLWPDTSGVREWWEDANRREMLDRSSCRYIKVVDPGSTDGPGKRRVAAWAKWDLAMPEERKRRYPPWHEDMPGEECDVFFGREERERERVMGGLTHFYLDTLATHPQYQRQGAASILVKWGCDLADQYGVGTYVDASKAGAPLYERFGFVDESGPDVGEVASMARR